MRLLRKKKSVLFAAIVLSVVLASSPRLEAGGQQDIEREIQRLRSEISALKASEKTTAQRIETLRLERTLHIREAERLAMEIPSVENRIAELGRQESDIEASLNRRREELGSVLRSLYINGRLSRRLLYSVLSMPEAGQVALAYTYMSALAQRERDFIDNYNADLQQLAAKRQELHGTRRKLMLLQNEERQASDSAMESEREHQRLLLQIRDRLDGLMEQLAKAVSGAPDIGFTARKGLLVWPSSGELVARFGRNQDRDYNVEFECDGIEIKAEAGTPVRAVHSGKVVFSDWIDERGNMVVLDHGRGYYTLYAHLAAFDVKLGDQVTEGQKLGTVGETGSLKGPILHFEIREFARALDPEQWLRRNR